MPGKTNRKYNRKYNKKNKTKRGKRNNTRKKYKRTKQYGGSNNHDTESGLAKWSPEKQKKKIQSETMRFIPGPGDIGSYLTSSNTNTNPTELNPYGVNKIGVSFNNARKAVEESQRMERLPPKGTPVKMKNNINKPYYINRRNELFKYPPTFKPKVHPSLSNLVNGRAGRSMSYKLTKEKAKERKNRFRRGKSKKKNSSKQTQEVVFQKRTGNLPTNPHQYVNHEQDEFSEFQRIRAEYMRQHGLPQHPRVNLTMSRPSSYKNTGPQFSMPAGLLQSNSTRLMPSTIPRREQQLEKIRKNLNNSSGTTKPSNISKAESQKMAKYKANQAKAQRQSEQAVTIVKSSKKRNPRGLREMKKRLAPLVIDGNLEIGKNLEI